MDSKSVESFLLHNAGCFDEYDVPRIAEGLARVPDEAALKVLGSEFKKPYIAMVLSVVGGALGVDRFYLGQTTLGVFKLLTCGGFGIWSVVDIFMIMGEARSCNAEKIVSLINRLSVKTQRPQAEVAVQTVQKETPSLIEEAADTQSKVIVNGEVVSAEPEVVTRTPGSENPMDYAPKEDSYAQYAPKPQNNDEN